MSLKPRSSARMTTMFGRSGLPAECNPIAPAIPAAEVCKKSRRVTFMIHPLLTQFERVRPSFQGAAAPEAPSRPPKGLKFHRRMPIFPVERTGHASLRSCGVGALEVPLQAREKTIARHTPECRVAASGNQIGVFPSHHSRSVYGCTPRASGGGQPGQPETG